MNRPQQVRQVFFELRRAISSDVAAGDLLDYANQLVDEFFGEEEPRFELRLGGRPFDEWSLDAVFSDGGWRVLERYQGESFDGDEETVNDPLLFGQFKEIGLEMCI